MRVAVLANHPQVFSFLSYLHSVEVDVVLFWSGEKTQLPEELCQKNLSTHFESVQWIQKRTFSSKELQGKQRMQDLFRVVYQKKPEISNQDTPSITPEMFSSLSEPLDFFQDVDVVITMVSGAAQAHCAHPTGAPVLGELKVQGRKNWYYEENFEEAFDGMEQIALIGESLALQEKLPTVLRWLSQGYTDKKNRMVFWISTLSNPWSAMHTTELESLKAELTENYQQQVQYFLNQKQEWDQLEDYQKVKVAKPKEPLELLQIFAGHHLSSVDTLLNSSKFYLTLEYERKRQAKIQLANTEPTFKTISVDRVGIFQGKYFKFPWKHYDLMEDESGVLHFVPEEYTLKQMINSFETQILPFFKRETDDC